MAQLFDTIVIGGGAMGSAAAYYLARAGERVLLLEQFAFDHAYGSSHGLSRVIRYAYDKAAYIDLIRDAFPLWFALQDASGEKLYQRTGGLDLGHADEPTFQQTLANLDAQGIPYERLSPADVMREYPGFQLADDAQIAYQADYGILKASACVRAHLKLAQDQGAVLQPESPVTQMRIHPRQVEVKTEDNLYLAARLVITAGAWTRELLKPLGLDLPLTVTRAQLQFFQPDPLEAYDVDRFPIFASHYLKRYGDLIYSVPNHEGSGVKVAFHSGAPVADVNAIDYQPSVATTDKIRAFLRDVHPPLDTTLKEARVCLYTMTPDEDFILDRHPQYPNVVFGAGFSGHGFKFSTLIGKILSDLVLTGQAKQDISLFRWDRFNTLK